MATILDQLKSKYNLTEDDLMKLARPMQDRMPQEEFSSGNDDALRGASNYGEPTDLSGLEESVEPANVQPSSMLGPKASITPAPVSPELLGLGQNASFMPSKKDPLQAIIDSGLYAPQSVKAKEQTKSSAQIDTTIPSSDRMDSAPLKTTPEGFTNASVEALKAAQQKANDTRNASNMMRALNTFNAGVSTLGTGRTPAKVDNEYADVMLKQADIPIEQYKQLVEEEIRDPNSTYSVGFKNFLKPIAEKLNIVLPENASAEQIQKAFPQLANIYNQKMAQEARRDDLKLRMGEMSLRRDELSKQRQDRLDMTLENQVNNRFDKNTKDEVARIQAAKRVKSLITAIENGALVDSNNIRNTLTNDVSILALPVGTRGTLADREKAAINTLSTKMKDMLQYVTDNPQKTIPPKFIKQLKSETDILEKKYIEALDQKTRSLEKGTNNPTAKKLMRQRASEFLGEENIETSEFPKTVMNKKTGQQATVSSKEELEEAKKEGFE